MVGEANRCQDVRLGKGGGKTDRKGFQGGRKRCVGVSPPFRSAWVHKSSSMNTGPKSKLDPVRQRAGGF